MVQGQLCAYSSSGRKKRIVNYYDRCVLVHLQLQQQQGKYTESTRSAVRYNPVHTHTPAALHAATRKVTVRWVHLVQCSLLFTVSPALLLGKEKKR